MAIVSPSLFCNSYISNLYFFQNPDNPADHDQLLSRYGLNGVYLVARYEVHRAVRIDHNAFHNNAVGRSLAQKHLH